MEVSSHALALDRVEDVHFRVAASDQYHARSSRLSSDARSLRRRKTSPLSHDARGGAQYRRRARRALAARSAPQGTDADLLAARRCRPCRSATSNPTPRERRSTSTARRCACIFPAFSTCKRAGRDRRRDHAGHRSGYLRARTRYVRARGRTHGARQRRAISTSWSTTRIRPIRSRTR